MKETDEKKVHFEANRTIKKRMVQTVTLRQRPHHAW